MLLRGLYTTRKHLQVVSACCVSAFICFHYGLLGKRLIAGFSVFPGWGVWWW